MDVVIVLLVCIFGGLFFLGVKYGIICSLVESWPNLYSLLILCGIYALIGLAIDFFAIDEKEIVLSEPENDFETVVFIVVGPMMLMQGGMESAAHKIFVWTLYALSCLIALVMWFVALITELRAKEIAAKSTDLD